jgi:methionyl-tRNA formyltransferase
VTYAHKIDKAEAQIDWTAAAAQLARPVRAFDPFPGCSTELEGLAFKVWRGPGGAGPRPARAAVGSGPGRLVVACGRMRWRCWKCSCPAADACAARELVQRLPALAG